MAIGEEVRAMGLPESRSAAVALIAVLAAGPIAPPPVAAFEGKPAPAPQPFPVDKTRKLTLENAVYTVKGRVRIPRGVEITVLRSIRIVGEGSEPAVLEVEGGFDCIGVSEREVILDNVTVEPQAKFERIHMDMAIFQGSGGIRSPKETSVDGYFLLENFDAVEGATVDLVQHGGSFELSSACADDPVRLRTVLPPGKDKGSVRVFVRGCHQEPRHRCTPHGGRVGLAGGLDLDGGDDVTVQLSRIGGAKCSVRNWGSKFIFDGNKVNASVLEFAHEKPGMFQRLQCAKLDISSATVLARAPVHPTMKDTLTMDRCWFKGLVDPREILEKVVKDGADEPEKNGSRVVLPKVNARPLELAGPADR
jgi:hypothetical protein